MTLFDDGNHLKIIDGDAPPPALFPKRIELTDRQIARSLRLSRDVTRDLLRKYLRAKLIHAASDGERRAGLGWCAEDLTGLILMAELHAVRGISFRVAAKMCTELVRLLAGYPREMRLLLLVVDQGKYTELEIQGGPREDTIEVLPQNKGRTVIFDARALEDTIETGLHETPFRLPRASDCSVRA